MSGSFGEPTQITAFNPHNSPRSHYSDELYSINVEIQVHLEPEFEPMQYDL